MYINIKERIDVNQDGPSLIIEHGGGGGEVDDSVVGKLHGSALLWAGNGCVWGRQWLCCVIISGLACAYVTN